MRPIIQHATVLTFLGAALSGWTATAGAGSTFPPTAVREAQSATSLRPARLQSPAQESATPDPSPSPETTRATDPAPTPTATVEPLPTDTAPPPTATAARRPIYLPWVDKLAASAKQAPLDEVAGNFVRLALGPRQLFAVEDAPPRLSVLFTNKATGRLERAGSMPLDAPGLDPRTVRLAADAKLDYAYLLYFNAFTVLEAVNPPQPRKLLAAPDCDGLAIASWSAILGCDGLRTIDLENPEAAKELYYLRRPGRSQGLVEEDGLLAAAFREPVPASRPTSLVLYHNGYRQPLRLAGQLPDIGNTVAMVMRSRTVYQLVDEDGRRGLQLIDTANDDGNRTPRLLMRIDMDGIPRDLALDPGAQRLYVLEEGWFDRRDRKQHGQNGVRVYSLKDPRQPRLWRFLPLDQPAASIAAADGLLYVAGGSAGLGVYRVE